MSITTAMGHGAGLGGQGGGAPRREVIERDSKCIPGHPGATSSTVGPPPRRSRRTGTRAPPRSGMRDPYAPADRGRVPGDRLRIPYGRPPPRYDRPGSGGATWDPGDVDTGGAPRCTRRPTSSCGGTGRLIRFIPRGAIAVQGAQGARAQRTGTPAETSAAPPPRGTRMSRTPGDRSPSTARGTRPGCTGSTGRTFAPAVLPAVPGTPRCAARTSPASSDLFDVSTAGVLPGGPARAGAAGGGSQGGPRRPPRYRRGRGSDRLDVLPVASPVSGDPRYAIPTGARPRTGRSYAPGAPAGDVPAAPPAALGDRSPGYTTPPAIGISLPAATRCPPGTSS